MSVQRGFTLIELLVSLAVAAILVSIATPFFRETIIKNRLDSISLEFADALALARSESIKRNRTITFCRADKASPASRSDNVDSVKCANGTDWEYWLITQKPDSATESNVIGRGNISSLSSSIKITSANITNNRVNFNTDGLIRSGGALVNNAEFTICAKNINKNAIRTLKLSAAGRISIKPSDGECK